MKLKRCFALALSLCLAMSMALVGSAASPATSPDDTGTVTISGLDDGLNVDAYEIAHGEYDDDGNFLGYVMDAEGTAFAIGYDGSFDEDALTEANLAELFNAVKDAGSAASEISENGSVSFELGVGSYLFVVTGSEAVVYGMVIGSVSYAADDEGWIIDGGAVDVTGDNLWIKSTEPTVEKTEHGGSVDEEGDFEHGGSADVGDTLEYHINIGPIPSYEGDYPVFNIVDQISENLEITDEELAALTVEILENGEVIAVLTEGVDYTVARTESGFVLDFVVDGAYTLNAYAGDSILVDYEADITGAGDVDADDADHTNDVILNYSTNSYMYGEDGSHEDVDHDYTFNVKAIKTDAGDPVYDEDIPLSGAEFSLYTDEACSEAYTQNGEAVVAVSGSDGYFEFTGLEEGTYYMKETKAPAGYALNQTVYRVEITASYKEDGSLDEYTVEVFDGEELLGSAAVSDTNVRIINTKVGMLPSTGGTGTTLLLIGGCIVMLGAAVVISANRRRA